MLRKTMSFQTIGVAPLRDGIASFHAMFSPVDVDHFTGSPFSPLTPVNCGPRHCGQLSAESMATDAEVTRSVTNRRLRFTRMKLLQGSIRPGGRPRSFQDREYTT